MNKEIVIAAHNESTSWIPPAWCPLVTIYRCGEPIHSPSHKMRYAEQQYRRRTMQMTSRLGTDGEDPLFVLEQQLTACRMILQISDEITNRSPRSVAQSATLLDHAEKKTENCTSSREARQWLNHIIWRYDTLADVTVFLQAHPHDHCGDIISSVDAIQNVHFTTLPTRSSGTISKADAELCNEFYRQLFTEPLDTVCWAAGAQFAASRKVLRAQPCSWYVKIRDLATTTVRSGEILERLWWNVLGCPVSVNVESAPGLGLNCGAA